MYRILVADDEEKIRTLIRKYAEFEGHQITEAQNGMEAVRLCRKDSAAFDLIIMDVMMPELDGFSAAAEIKKLCAVPVLMLSARGEEYDKIHGFELGADDYVVKPFSPKELMLRVNAIMNRVRPKEAAQKPRDTASFGGLAVDFDARVVMVDGQRADLSPKEYELLSYLIKNRGLALTREMLLTHVWGYDFYGDDRTLDTHIKLLRKRLGPYSKYIVTLRGVGYRFDGPEERRP
ncbi:MAG: response regulator transcription factor [Acutalibacter sp.]|nr:response regulator transcription factor [Acutalibacter sp.]